MTHLTRIRVLGLTVQRFGALTGYSPVTVYNWGKTRSKRGIQQVPRAITLLLDAWEAHPELIPEDKDD